MEKVRDTNQSLKHPAHKLFLLDLHQGVHQGTKLLQNELTFDQNQHKFANLFFHLHGLKSFEKFSPVSPYDKVCLAWHANNIQCREDSPYSSIEQRPYMKIDPNMKMFWFCDFLYNEPHIY